MLRNALSFLSALALALTACQPAATPTPESEHEGHSEGLSIEDAWARPSMMVDGAVAVYFEIHNEGGDADRLIAASSPAAANVELHESLEENGVMSMRPVEAIEVPAGGHTELKPGGLHIMLINLVEPLEVGDTIEVTLAFENAGDKMVTAEVRKP
jgi:hypothetical protein